MGAGASLLEIAEQAPETRPATDRPVAPPGTDAKSEIMALLQAYHITTKEDIIDLNTRYEALKAADVTGKELLLQMHRACVTIMNSHKKKFSLYEIVVRARERVAILMRQVSVEAFNNFMVGTDGSPEASNAMEVCMAELIKSKDGIIALHAFDSTKSDVAKPAHMRCEKLREATEVLLMSRTVKRFSLNWVNMRGKPVDAFILKTVNEIVSKRETLKIDERPSFFVIGVARRKKLDQMPLSYVAAGQFELPTIIIKQSPVLDRPRVFVAAIKDLEHVEPYDVAHALLKPGNGDILVVIHLHLKNEMKADIQAKRDYFEARIKEDGLLKNGSMFVAKAVQGQNPVEELIKHVEELQTDYLILYPSICVGKVELKPSCQEIIDSADCNIVVCHH
jgi:hypothetical protein